MLKKMMPFRLVVAIPVLIIALVVIGLVLSPLSKNVAEKGASTALCTNVTFASMSISPFTGNIVFQDLKVQDRDNPKENLFSAEKGEGDISLYELLRGRAVIEKLSLSSVRMHVKRKKDGSLNIEDLGKKKEEISKPSEEEKKSAEKTDWVDTIKKISEKLNKWAKKKKEEKKKQEEGKGGKKPEKIPPEKLPDARATYMDLAEPFLVIKQIVIDDVEIKLTDETKEKPVPELKEGSASILNLSSNPFVLKDPASFKLKGQFGGVGMLYLDGKLSLNWEKESLLGLKSVGKDIDLKQVGPLCGLSVPVNIKQGVVNFDSSFLLKDFSSIELTPLLEITDLNISPEPGRDKLIGIPAKQFCEAVNYAKGFAIKGLSITGTLSMPQFSWSSEFQESLKKLLQDAGKGYLTGEAKKQINKVTSKIGKKIEKKIGSEVGDKISKKIGNQIGDKATKEAKKILDQGLNIFGGKDK